MAGRAKQKVYQYAADGRYIQSWSSVSLLTRAYYPKDISMRPLFATNEIRQMSEDSTVVSRTRIGKAGVINFLKRKSNPYVDRHKGGGFISGKPVEVYDLDDKLIASFSDADIAAKMLKMSASLIYSRFHTPPRHGRDGLMFKLIK